MSSWLRIRRHTVPSEGLAARAEDEENEKQRECLSGQDLLVLARSAAGAFNRETGWMSCHMPCGNLQARPFPLFTCQNT